ncbi:MAG: hypothetical protein U0791_02945 [Gemmataceae bacterium]
MKLLTSVLPRGTRLLPAGGWFTLLVAGSLVALEVAGRFAQSDVHDGLAAFALLGLTTAVVVRHRRDPIPWVGRLAAWAKRVALSADWIKYDHGVDLRGTPPLPRKMPRVMWLIASVLVLWGVLAGFAWYAFPDGWRIAGLYSSYLLYLAGLTVLWCALLACTFIGVYVPVAVIDRTLRGWVGETDRRGAELAAVVGYAVLVSAIAYSVPATAILVLCLVVAAGAVLSAIPRGRDGAAILWRAGPNQTVYAIPLHRVIGAVVALLSLLIFDVLLTSCGRRLFADGEGTMPVTSLFGAVAAWVMPGLFVVAAARLFAARRIDPARTTRPTLHIGGGDAKARRAAAALARKWGWKVQREPTLRDSSAVGITLVPPENSEATEFDPRWPLKLSIADLEAGAVKERLERRDELQVRRQFFRGLAKLFKRASAFKGPGGGGYWLAPHWWFFDGLGREDSDSADENAPPPLVGPPYHRILPARSRQSMFRILRATQIDMIFVEDGVGYRKLERVIRVLLELYDKHDGKRKAEELHFRGLPKVRVMIHEYEPGNPFKSDLYPEPKMDDISRVRVLHLFRDRGGEEEEVEPPFDFEWSPAPFALVS